MTEIVYQSRMDISVAQHFTNKINIGIETTISANVLQTNDFRVS
jgi:uncharacterized membrane protein